jgi:hypothetical protein
MCGAVKLNIQRMEEDDGKGGERKLKRSISKRFN